MASSTDYYRRLKRLGIPTKDAQKPFHITITRKDTKGAVPGAPKHCVFANKLCREVGIKEVHVFNRTAHVIQYDEEEKRYVSMRYSLDAEARLAIKMFDAGKAFPPGHYTFRALPKSRRKEVKRKYDASRPDGAVSRPDGTVSRPGVAVSRPGGVTSRPGGVVSRNNGKSSPSVKVYMRKYESNFRYR